MCNLEPFSQMASAKLKGENDTQGQATTLAPAGCLCLQQLWFHFPLSIGPYVGQLAQALRLPLNQHISINIQWVFPDSGFPMTRFGTQCLKLLGTATFTFPGDVISASASLAARDMPTSPASGPEPFMRQLCLHDPSMRIPQVCHRWGTHSPLEKGWSYGKTGENKEQALLSRKVQNWCLLPLRFLIWQWFAFQLTVSGVDDSSVRRGTKAPIW